MIERTRSHGLLPLGPELPVFYQPLERSTRPWPFYSRTDRSQALCPHLHDSSPEVPVKITEPSRAAIRGPNNIQESSLQAGPRDTLLGRISDSRIRQFQISSRSRSSRRSDLIIDSWYLSQSLFWFCRCSRQCESQTMVENPPRFPDRLRRHGQFH